MFSYIVLREPKSDTVSTFMSNLFEAFQEINPNGDVLTSEWGYHGLSVHEVVIVPSNMEDKDILGVEDIKVAYPFKTLVTVLDNSKGKKSFMELVAYALKVKSNLFIEIVEGSPVNAGVCDPLGNNYIFSTDVKKIALVLHTRISKLLHLTRMPCIATEERFPPEIKPPENFLKTIRMYADKFHDMLHPVGTERFLGNCSFRCEHGFPSYRDKDWVFVSRRNTDKRGISAESFVPVKLSENGTEVLFLGNHRPSVDTPVQLLLYRYYPKMKFMFHAHVYFKHGEMSTEEVLPCGAIEEYYEIIKAFPGRDHAQLFLQLKGHGILIMSDFGIDDDFLLEARPAYEQQEY